MMMTRDDEYNLRPNAASPGLPDLIDKAVFVVATQCSDDPAVADLIGCL